LNENTRNFWIFQKKVALMQKKLQLTDNEKPHKIDTESLKKTLKVS